MADQVTAGRELDAMVAERVMGYTAEDVDLMERGYSFALPPYSTNIAAAWLVVARMREMHPGWRFCLLGGDTSLPYTLPGGTECGGYFGWHAEWFGHEDAHKNFGQRHGEAYAATEPLAICRAALLAVASQSGSQSLGRGDTTP